MSVRDYALTRRSGPAAGYSSFALTRPASTVTPRPASREAL